jgi:hypothetical protein
VESQPPASTPAFINASYSGNSFRREKKLPREEEDSPATCEVSISRANALTTKRFKLIPCSKARIFARRYSDSGMSIVVFTCSEDEIDTVYFNMVSITGRSESLSRTLPLVAAATEIWCLSGESLAQSPAITILARHANRCYLKIEFPTEVLACVR